MSCVGETIGSPFEGESRFHQISSKNHAAMISRAARDPRTRVLNGVDPFPYTVQSMGETIARAMDHSWRVVTIPGPPRASVGDTPWSVPHPFVLDLSAAESEIGASSVTSYEAAIAEVCEWLVSATEGRDWRDVLPDAARHYGDLFDYDSEDAFLGDMEGRTR